MGMRGWMKYPHQACLPNIPADGIGMKIEPQKIEN
jgi:hypothetical protein